MEFFRKTCGGRIEELTGQKAALINADIYLRSLGLYQVAQQEYNSYRPEERAPLDAFVAGVNASISGRSPQQLSVNYTILGLTRVKFKVEPWPPLDTLVFSKLMAWDLGLSRDAESIRTRLYAKLGTEMAEQWLVPPWPLGRKPTVMLEEDLKVSYPATSHLRNPSPDKNLYADTDSYDSPSADLSSIIGQTEGLGSNSWAATGNMTQGGKALLANDPHLGIQQPSIWYEVALHCPDDGTGRPFDVSGFSFALARGRTPRSSPTLFEVAPLLHRARLGGHTPDRYRQRLAAIGLHRARLGGSTSGSGLSDSDPPRRARRGL